GLSPAVTEELFEAFDRMRHEIAMVVVDHHLDLALALSDRTVVLERGAVTWTGSSAALKDDLTLREEGLWRGANGLLSSERDSSVAPGRWCLPALGATSRSTMRRRAWHIRRMG